MTVMMMMMMIGSATSILMYVCYIQELAATENVYTRRKIVYRYRSRASVIS